MILKAQQRQRSTGADEKDPLLPGALLSTVKVTVTINGKFFELL